LPEGESRKRGQSQEANVPGQREKEEGRIYRIYYNYSIFPGGHNENSWLKITYYQRFLEIPLD
jgi:hypothetical protein